MLPLADGRCPSCRASTAGAATIAIAPDERGAAGAAHQARVEALARDVLARHQEKRASWQKLGGGLAIFAGVVLTAVSFMNDSTGNTIWYGAVFAGVALLLRAYRTERAIDRLLSER